MRTLGDICKKTEKIISSFKKCHYFNSSPNSPVAPIVSRIPPFDGPFNGEYFIKRGLFCRMRPLGDICKKPRKLFRLSKNVIISNCSTDLPVAPIVSGITPVDASLNGEYFIKRGLFL